MGNVTILIKKIANWFLRDMHENSFIVDITAVESLLSKAITCFSAASSAAPLSGRDSIGLPVANKIIPPTKSTAQMRDKFCGCAASGRLTTRPKPAGTLVSISQDTTKPDTLIISMIIATTRIIIRPLGIQVIGFTMPNASAGAARPTGSNLEASLRAFCRRCLQQARRSLRRGDVTNPHPRKILGVTDTAPLGQNPQYFPRLCVEMFAQCRRSPPAAWGQLRTYDMADRRIAVTRSDSVRAGLK
jgi:hypothetical protein